MELRVLGPVQAREGRRTFELGGARQRRLLCALLLDPGEVVGVDALLERVWADDDRPDQAVRALRSSISRLRTTFPRGDRLIDTGPGGYAVNLDGHELDLWRVEALAG